MMICCCIPSIFDKSRIVYVVPYKHVISYFEEIEQKFTKVKKRKSEMNQSDSTWFLTDVIFYGLTKE